MAAIDDAPAEAPVLLRMLVEMDLGGVLIEPRRGHMAGFFDGHAVEMIDPLAGLVVVPEMRAAGQGRVVAREIDRLGQERGKIEGAALG